MPGADVLDVFERPGIQIVDTDHRVPLFQQEVAEMGSDKAGSAGDYAGGHEAGCYSTLPDLSRDGGGPGRGCQKTRLLTDSPTLGRGSLAAGYGLKGDRYVAGY